MNAVQAIYDGRVFIPEKPCNITSGSKVIITIETAIGGISEKHKKLEAFRKLTDEVAELNETDPLPPEFDEIVSQRLRFREFPGL
jgi:predicted DNA-binding antitoxin AbrB/MazE fold protein